MIREESPRCWPRRPLAALFVAAAFLGTVTRAQSPQANPEDRRGYRDLVKAATGTYGVELRGTDDPARIEARVGPNTSLADKFRATRFPARASQPFAVNWSAREVSVNAGGQSINYRAAWQTGDAVRLSARGDARVTIVTAGGKRVGQTIAGTASSSTSSELVLAGAHLTGNWTIEGTIDWPDEPGPDDGVLVTVGRQDPAVAAGDRKRPSMFTGGIADPFVFSPPDGLSRSSPASVKEVTLRWTGNASGQDSRRWSVAANWNPQRVPVAGDVVELGSGTREKAPINDLATDPLLGGIVVSDNSYELGGNGLRLAPNSFSRIDEYFRVDSLEGGGTIQINGATIFTVGNRLSLPLKSSTTFSGALEGGTGSELVKDGLGTLIFAGVATGIQLTTVEGGSFALADGARMADLTVENRGGTFGGLPGTAQTGSFRIDNAIYEQAIGPGGAGLLNVTGSVNISGNGSTTLKVNLAAGYIPPANRTIIIIQNDGTDVSAGRDANDYFRGASNERLLEGDLFTVGGVTFRLSYKCSAEATPAVCNDPGTGNDIGLTAVQSGPVARPDLTVTKAHAGNFTQGQSNATYTITVANAGNAPTSGTVTLTDTLPLGLAATSLSGPGWSCDLPTLTCSRGDALTAGASFPQITLTVNVAGNAPASVTNAATVSAVGESSTTNNTATDVTTILGPLAPGPDLTIDKAHTGNFTQGQVGATYAITVANTGSGPTNAPVKVTDTLPSGLTATALSGTGWSCTLATLACTRSDVLAPDDSYPAVTLTVTVAANAVNLVNTAAVSGGGDVRTDNNRDDDATTIGAGPDLTIRKTHAGNFTQGQIGATYAITVTNSGNASTNAPVTVTDTLPAGMTATGLGGTGWSCTLATLTCTRSDALTAGSGFPGLTLTVSVAANAGASLINSATVAGGGDVNLANNTATDPTNVTPVLLSPRLAIAKSHEGDFFVGQQGATYTVLVSNAGTASTSGEVVVSDPLPLGMTPVSAGGIGWTCSVEAQTVDCRRSDALAPQQVYPALTITVNVGLVAMTTTNIATVSGGGDQQPGASAPDATTILGRPQLTILKSHPGPVIQGERGLPFAVIVSNSGSGPTAGTVTVTDTLPAGLAPIDVSGPGWNCLTAGATVTCSRSDVLSATQSYPVIQIRADVAADAISTVNDATVSGGGDTTPNDNIAHDPVHISPAGQPNLVIAKTHEGDFTQGQQGAAYRLSVTNFGQAPTVGVVTVIDNLPGGLTPASAVGSGWACTIASPAVTCTRSDALAPGAAFPLIVLLVNVAANATDVVNVASVSGGGDQTTGDNTSTDGTHIVVQAPDLTVLKRHGDPFITGQQGASYRMTVTNVGTAPTVGEVVVVDPVPAGLTPVSGSGNGWSCAVAGRTLTCRRSDSLTPGASFPDITLLVNVDPNASNLVNICRVSGGGDANPDNNVDGDSTSVGPSPDPTISLSRSTSLVVLETAEYEAVVTNLGPGMLGGQTDVVAVFPAEIVPVSGLGNGWQCTTAGQRIRCSRVGPLAPDEDFATIQYRVVVRQGPTSITVTATVANDADRDLDNNVAVHTSDIILPTTSLTIVKRTTTPRVEIGGVAGYEIDVTNTGQAVLLNAAVHDRLPRGFAFVKSSGALRSATRTRQTAPVDAGDGNVEWPIESLAPGESVTLLYLAIVGAGARSGPQDNRATVDATGPQNAKITAGPAIATVEVTTEVFTMLQALVGRVFEDVDGNGMFGDGDRPLANARVITSTGQAALTDAAGLYNIPSLGAGTVAVSLDPATVPMGMTLLDGPGGRSWTRLLRTPVGGGGLLSQNFPLRRSAVVAPAAVPAAPAERTAPGVVPDEPDAGVVPPRRTYESRQGSSLMIALGEVSFGRAAQEFELFEKDKDAWGYGSVFYQGALGSPKNRLTFAADSRRRLNGTTDSNRLFELDPNDRKYPLFGDASIREEFATSNSKVFARVERGASYGMWGDLIGDLPSSDRDGGRWSSYQRHLTGAEFRLAGAKGNHVTIRGAEPKTTYAREVFAGGAVGWLSLRHPELLSGTETVAIEVRDRRMPERVLSRDVLRRGVDYQLEPATGTVYLQRHVSGLDPQLNLVQIVITYEYESAGLDQLVFGGRASATMSGLRIGGTFFTEEGQGDGRFTVGGFDLDQRLPRNGRLRFELPYSTGTPAVESSVDSRPVDPNARAEGFAVQAEVEQPFAFWNGVARGAYLQADNAFRNPFSATITPGATYAAGSAELSPFTSSRLKFGGTYERDDAPSMSLDARRSTVSGEWAQSVGGGVTLKAGYDGRSLDRNGVELGSGLFTGQGIVKFGDRLEARAGREQNVRDDKDPTYPDQTTLGARLKLAQDTSIFYTQRISDEAIVPIGNFAATGFSELATKGELNLGVESQVKDATQLTSGYRVEQGVNGPDAFALIGVFTHIKLGRTVGTSFGLERGQLIDGESDSYTTGSFAVDWLPSERFKATTRYEGRDRGGYSSRLSAGLAARLHAGVTGLTRVQWAQSAENTATAGDAVGVLAALAVRPATNDRLGWLLSYQYVDRDVPLQTVAPGRSSSGWRHLFSTDGYAHPLQWLELHGKFAWQRSEVIDLRTDTYLWQGRAQFALSRFVDAAFEERYLYQPASNSHREGTATEIGFWLLADVRIAVGYNFRDTRDPFGRDLQGRDKGAYLTLSTKLSRLFDLLGSKPPK